MAAPNLVNIIALYGKTATYAATTTLAVALENAAASNKVLKISSIFCSNVNGSADGDISISIYNGTVDRYIAKDLTVPPKATQLITTKDASFYLEEGSSIRAIASANTTIEVIIAYEEIS